MLGFRSQQDHNSSLQTGLVPGSKVKYSMLTKRETNAHIPSGVYMSMDLQQVFYQLQLQHIACLKFRVLFLLVNRLCLLLAKYLAGATRCQ